MSPLHIPKLALRLNFDLQKTCFMHSCTTSTKQRHYGRRREKCGCGHWQLGPHQLCAYWCFTTLLIIEISTTVGRQIFLTLNRIFSRLVHFFSFKFFPKTYEQGCVIVLYLYPKVEVAEHALFYMSCCHLLQYRKYKTYLFGDVPCNFTVYLPCLPKISFYGSNSS